MSNMNQVCVVKYLFAMALLVVFPVILLVVETRGYDEQALVEPPSSVAGSRFVNAYSSQWVPSFHEADKIVKGYYDVQGVRYELFWASYREQTQGKELIFVENTLFHHTRWQLTKTDNIPMLSSQVKQVALSGRAGVRDIVYWYVIAGRVTSNNLMAKILQVIGYIEGRRDATVVALSLSGSDKLSDASRQGLVDFSQQFFQLIETNKN